MPLPTPPAERSLIHTRSVRFEGFKRADGLWDIEGHLTDVKTVEARLASGVRPAGEPVHDMWIRLTIDRELNVLEAAAASDAVPYPGHCDDVTPAFHRLAGLNLARGFRKAVQDLFGGVQGCTHLTELLMQFPTAAIQARAGEKPDNEDQGVKPFQLDRCHALDTRGEAVQRYYPRWYRGAKTGAFKA
jgi:hypothetical protein